MKAIEEAMKTDPTIHALATQFSELHESNTKAYHHAKDVLTWLFDKPLADRLRAEEREKIKVIYHEELGMAQHFHAKAKESKDISCRQHYFGLREPYISRMRLLERIFGKDMFEEEGGSDE